LDICSTAPLESISLLFIHHNSELGFKVLNMLRLWRLNRVSSLFARFASISYLTSWPLFHRLIYLLEYANACLLSDSKRTFASIIFGLDAQSSLL
jgi:hypothetical protein